MTKMTLVWELNKVFVNFSQKETKTKHGYICIKSTPIWKTTTRDKTNTEIYLQL